MARIDNDARMAGRELALGMLCHLESYPPAEWGQARDLLWDNPPRGDADGEDTFATLVPRPAPRAFATELVETWIDHRATIDEAITATSKRWRLERMDRVDRNVVRLATVELAHFDATPRGAIVAEAVRLAAAYGGEHSVKFVNGLVESLAGAIRPDAKDPPEPRDG